MSTQHVPGQTARRGASSHRPRLRGMQLAYQGPGLGIRTPRTEAEHPLLPHAEARHRQACIDPTWLPSAVSCASWPPAKESICATCSS